MRSLKKQTMPKEEPVQEYDNELESRLAEGTQHLESFLGEGDLSPDIQTCSAMNPDAKLSTVCDECQFRVECTVTLSD